MPKYVVRHGVMRELGVFSTKGSDSFHRGQQVIARTSRGQEAGEVLCESSEHTLSQMSDPRHGQILRAATHEDQVELQKIQEQLENELETCRKQIASLGLEMQLVDAEHLYGGERVVFYYLAEGRIDFRELVKQLAKELQTRIEMRQIGVRDEAKLLADYGDCGKPVCCNTHLSEMPPVSMKMAKLQKATLDPNKISGRCGRLKCCLRYEYDTYRELQQDLPKVGSEVLTAKGKGKVLAQELLAGQLLIQTEEMRRVMIDQSEVLSVISKPKPAAKKSSPSHSGRGDKPPASKTPDSQGPTSQDADSTSPVAKGEKAPSEQPPTDQTSANSLSQAAPTKTPSAGARPPSPTADSTPTEKSTENSERNSGNSSPEVPPNDSPSGEH